MSLRVRRRNLREFEHEWWLMVIAEAEVGRLVHFRVERGFVLPSVTVVASIRDEVEFMRPARKELGIWHSKWNFYLGAAAKRRAFRECGPKEHLLLVSGVLVIDGAIEKFSEYEREFWQRVAERRTIS